MLLQRSYHQTEGMTQSQRNVIESKVLNDHAPFINSILKPYMCVFDEGTIEELRQIALMTFLLELRKFSHVVNDYFIKSATVRVRGEVIDELRRRDPMERRKRQLVNNVKKAEATLAQKLGRLPTAPEICRALGISSEDFHQAMQVIVIDDEVELDSLVMNAKDDASSQTLLELEKTLESLDEVQQKIMFLLFVEGLNIKETALVLDLSESKIFRLKQTALKELKQQFSED